MSYCRRDVDSDVYVFEDSAAPTRSRPITCFACSITETETGNYYSAEEMLVHLRDHVKAGDRVPERAFQRLREEARLDVQGRKRK